jgi:hypothetical protein
MNFGTGRISKPLGPFPRVFPRKMNDQWSPPVVLLHQYHVFFFCSPDEKKDMVLKL